jgi:hypothetical protein
MRIGKAKCDREDECDRERKPALPRSAEHRGREFQRRAILDEGA